MTTTTVMTTTLPNYVPAPAILAGFPTYGSAPERPVSTIAGPRQSHPAALMIDLVMPTPQQWELLRRLDKAQAAPERERWLAADRPHEQAFADARSFIRRLPPCPVRLPNIGVADDGEVNFLWEGDGIYIDLGFYGAGTFSYFARAGDGQRFYGDDLSVSGILPGNLVNLIRGELN